MLVRGAKRGGRLAAARQAMAAGARPTPLVASTTRPATFFPAPAAHAAVAAGAAGAEASRTVDSEMSEEVLGR